MFQVSYLLVLAYELRQVSYNKDLKSWKSLLGNCYHFVGTWKV